MAMMVEVDTHEAELELGDVKRAAIMRRPVGVTHKLREGAVWCDGKVPATRVAIRCPHLRRDKLHPLASSLGYLDYPLWNRRESRNYLTSRATALRHQAAFSR